MVKLRFSRATVVKYLLLLVPLVALLVYHLISCLNLSLRHPYLLQTLSKQSRLLHSWMESDPSLSLVSGAPSMIVHYLWCRKGTFEFKHYLSVLSAIKLLQPDLVLFHYNHLPTKDTSGYDTWFEDLQRDIPFFKLNKHYFQYCKHDYFKNGDIEASGLGSSGVYLSDEVAVVNFTRIEFINLARSTGKMRIFFLPASEPHIVAKTQSSANFECPTLQNYHKLGMDKERCVQLTERLSPSDIWYQKKSFYRFARKLIYGTTDVQIPIRNDTTLMPLYCHILHFTESSDLNIIAYASILSALNVAKMDHVFLHGEVTPVGAHWESALLSRRVTFIPVTQVKRWHPEVGDMVYGAYVLLRHGGVVVRSNTIWRKEITQELRSYNTAASLRRSNFRIINHSVDLNILLSKPGSEYLKLLITTLKQSPARHRNAKSEEVAYRAYVDSPTSVKLEPSLLQHVQCSGSMCHPLAEDTGLSRSYAVEVEWHDGLPQSQAALATLRGPGIDDIKFAIHS